MRVRVAEMKLKKKKKKNIPEHSIQVFGIYALVFHSRWKYRFVDFLLPETRRETQPVTRLDGYNRPRSSKREKGDETDRAPLRACDQIAVKHFKL